MSTQATIVGGAFQTTTGQPLANGYLIFELSQDVQVTNDSDTSEEICAGIEIVIPLDENGNIVSDPAQTIWPNDVMSPSNTFYTVRAYSAVGQLVWGPNYQQVLSTPSPFDVGTWVPGAINVIGLGNPYITSLTTEGSSGPSTVNNGVLNVPQYSGGGGGGGVTPFTSSFSGQTFDGVNVTFTLPVTPSLLILQYNQGTLIPGEGLGYTTATVDGVFTITVTIPPGENDSLYASGLVITEGSSVTLHSSSFSGQTINGENVTFTLPFTPTILFLQYNQGLLIPGVGYTTAVVDGVFTITLMVAPTEGDALYATGILIGS